MNVLLTLGVSFTILITTVLRGGWVGYPLLLTLVLFCLVHWSRGIAPVRLGQMMAAGVRQSAGVLSILLLIGVLMAAWMAAGTVPTLVYYGLLWIQPDLFILSAFGLTGLVSLLIGTSFGAVGTVGLALMIMAQAGNGDLGWVAGAIIAGAYVGDRCSPMSSSAHLVATLTGTDLGRNLRAMTTTAMVPLLLSVGIYGVASRLYPLQATTPTFQRAIPTVFTLHWLTLLPAIAVFLLVALRVPVKRTMVISLGLAILLAVSLQGYGPLALIRFLGLGFRLQTPAELAPVLQGGGLLPMMKVCLVVVISTALAGLLAGTQTFGLIQRWLARLHTGRSLFLGTTGVSLLMAAYGCTQTIAILLTHQLTQPSYQQARIPQAQLALDLENTAVVLSPLIPWNIAGLVPATMLMTNAGFIPFAVYLYLLPLWLLLRPDPPHRHRSAPVHDLTPI